MTLWADLEADIMASDLGEPVSWWSACGSGGIDLRVVTRLPIDNFATQPGQRLRTDLRLVEVAAADVTPAKGDRLQLGDGTWLEIKGLPELNGTRTLWRCEAVEKRV